MACGDLAGGLELHFLNSGMRIQPIEGYIEDESRNFKKAEFEISEPAALLVQERGREAEPVHIELGGGVAHRMFLPEDAITIEHDITRETVGILTLEDALGVLDRAIISKSWDAISLPVFVEEVMDKRNDPNGVITETRYTDQDLKERMAARVRNSVGTGPVPVEKVEQVYGVMVTNADAMVGSFDFDNTNLLDAFQSVMDSFGLDAWVDRNGVLIIGKDPAWGESIALVEQHQLDWLAEYTVTEKARKTESVEVSGPFASTKFDWLDEWDPDWTSGPSRGYGIAERENVDEGAVIEIETEQAQSLSSLEQAAALHLITRAMDEVDGTVEFNGFMLPEDMQRKMARLTSGDSLVVDAAIPNSCAKQDQSYQGGHFFIQDVTQRMNGREGWRIVLRVAEIPTDLTTRSYRYNPRSGERYEDDRIYQGAGPGPNSRTLQSEVE